MKLVGFEATHAITHFDSHGATIAGIARCAGEVRVAVLALEPGGVVGMHETSSPQLLLVVDGEGNVRGDGEQPVTIVRGQAAFWEGGELHETATRDGLTAIVVEADELELGS